MVRLSAFVLVVAVAHLAFAHIYFEETFSDGDAWKSRWVSGKVAKEQGSLVLTAGKFFGDAEESKGLQTETDARHYAMSVGFPTFSNEGKDLVIQYTVKHEQKIDCGGGYFKLLASDVDLSTFNGDTPYYLMFGPDICGSSTKKTHVILGVDGTNHLINKDIKCETDQLSHLYTIIIRPDNTYEVRIDNKPKQSGSLKEDWSILKPKMIKDPAASKPADWVDSAEMADPTDVKPAEWDATPAMIADPDAKRPDDWDDDLDGDWEAPLIDNPAYKGEWSPRMIPNPAYKGPWVHPLVPNPDFVDNDLLYVFPKIGAIGFDLWQVKAGTIFDNIIITDSVAEAEAHGEAHWAAFKDAEKTAFNAAEEKRKAEEEEKRKAREAERKKKDEEERLKREAEEALEEDDGSWDAKDEL